MESNRVEITVGCLHPLVSSPADPRPLRISSLLVKPAGAEDQCDKLNLKLTPPQALESLVCLCPEQN